MTPKRLPDRIIIYGILSSAVVLLLGGLVATYLWSHESFLEIPIQTTTGDLGFRLNLKSLKCQDRDGIVGESAGFLGPCGNISGISLHGFKVINTSAIAISLRQSKFDVFLLEWFEAQGSRWREFEFRNGRIWDSDFHRGTFRNVVFDSIDLRGANFSESRFVDCTFRNSKILDSGFQGAAFERVTFENTECMKCDFRGAKFNASTIDRPFVDALYNETSILPIAAEDLFTFGFQYRQ